MKNDPCSIAVFILMGAGRVFVELWSTLMDYMLCIYSKLFTLVATLILSHIFGSLIFFSFPNRDWNLTLNEFARTLPWLSFVTFLSQCNIIPLGETSSPLALNWILSLKGLELSWGKAQAFIFQFLFLGSLSDFNHLEPGLYDSKSKTFFIGC